MHGSGGLQPNLTAGALSRSHSVRAGGTPGCDISGPIAHPVAPAEPLVQGRLNSEMAAYPRDRDTLDDHSP